MPKQENINHFQKISFSEQYKVQYILINFHTYSQTQSFLFFFTQWHCIVYCLSAGIIRPQGVLKEPQTSEMWVRRANRESCHDKHEHTLTDIRPIRVSVTINNLYFNASTVTEKPKESREDKRENDTELETQVAEKSNAAWANANTNDYEIPAERFWKLVYGI